MSETEANQTARNMPMTVHAQYIKDMSFENPGAPMAFRASSGKPTMDMNINVGAEDISTAEFPGVFEVTLRIRAQAKRDEKTSFIAEVEYAASVSFGAEVPENARHPMLMIEIPRLLFPFARMILSEMSQNGGYPALMITPVDFQALYMQKFAAEIAESEPAKVGKK